MLRTSLGHLTLDTCIYNASGPRTGSTDALAKIASSAAGAVLAKSATVNEQSGNDLPRTWQADKVASLNSEGLPNKGIGYYLASDAIASAKGKPYLVSLSGHNLADNLRMLSDAIATDGVDGIELNLACPNVIGHPIIAYDFDQLRDVLTAVQAHPGLAASKKLFGIKLPPYFDGPHFEKAATIINTFSCVHFVASINTVGNALVIDTEAEMPAIRPKNGFGGLSGPAVKYTALANVKKMRELLHARIAVVGVGGIETGDDVFNMLLCGAQAVQIGTCHWIEGPKCFDRIASELQAILRRKGYANVDAVRGQLKEWSKDGAAKSRAARQTTTPPATVSTATGMDPSALLFVIAGLIAVIVGLLSEKYALSKA
ncbi:hypothetical protein SDRG_14531 [Saprolegnia diclina VS20]|uniref:Dihydroorotate dehydrogenase catalytic domain-containing protein n=1 Tax=Saprolegnia diclina (strain VS20) TaxID=1156394 RepID=T0R6J9_SAPDV|nr:hypothetical protein SDRG_14531 [Saprolegnia diclina VS20]EQC27693.1 hypothetical protein SDRG_14531 [Saprolegnia diclina VS20]|eukprot:XP_008618888.1 hypothetical protein SDRG_14531 [Saprolegnia diclina VS20]